jgi:hypothetical protein
MKKSPSLSHLLLPYSEPMRNTYRIIELCRTEASKAFLVRRLDAPLVNRS